MAYFNWQPVLETGISEIDQQHQRLVAMINSLHDAMSKGQGQDVLSGLVQEMIEYTQVHFSTEEKLMEQYRYPQTMEHKNLHMKFVDQVVQFKQKLDAGQPIATSEVMGFLKDWLFQHIAKSDKGYVTLFKSQGL